MLVYSLSFRGIPHNPATGIVPAAHPNCRLDAGPSGYVGEYYSKCQPLAAFTKMQPKMIYFTMMKEDDRVIGLLTEIRDGIVTNNSYAARTAANSTQIRRDVMGIRLGDTGPDAKLRKDPLAPAERRQVDAVKKRYYELIRENPHCHLLTISRQIRRLDHSLGKTGGYKDDFALNNRASKEIKREQAGQPPF